jgi:murein L,D-transpeptidase YcbB/YkuD
MRNFLFIFIAILCAYSCSLSTTETTKAIKIDYSENLRIYLSKNYNEISSNAKIGGIELSNPDWINKLYNTTQHSPLWISDSLVLNKNAENLIQLLSTSYNYGLDTSYYYIRNLKKIIQNLIEIDDKVNRYATAAELELLLTNSYFLFGKHLNYGIVAKDSAKLISEIPRKEFTINLTEQLLNSYKTDSLVKILLSVQPQHQEYIKLQKQLTKYLKTASLSNESIRVKNYRLDSIKAYQQSKKALILHHYLNAQNNDSLYFLALKKFQTQHGLSPDGIIGKNTAKALSQSPYHDYKKIVMSLEKWRWKNNWDSNYIFVNIPSFQMKIYLNNKIEEVLNVVVGKARTSTAEINGKMEYMIVYPFWNLPYSISSKELLPKIKKDSTYLQRNNYEVFTKKHKALNINDIDWNTVTQNNFNYKIRQKGGGANSLGIIKFIFPNRHSIYFHDTPLKSFFKNDLRAYSHGCVRTQNPLKLAELILNSDNNEYNIDSVNAFIKSKKQIRITLNKKFPVHIHYFTSGTDVNNNLIFYKDIYGLDEKLEELMHLKNQSNSANIPELVSK